MRRLRLPALFVLAGAVFSCSPAPKPQFAYDRSVSFANLKTFDWYADPAEDKTIGATVVDTRWFEEHLKSAVSAELERKGLRPASGAAPDFYVDYHTRAAGIQQRDKYGLYSWWGPYNYIGTETAKQGTLALDVRDAEKKLIWRGAITVTVGSSPEEIDRQIRKYVGELFANYPPEAAGKG